MVQNNAFKLKTVLNKIKIATLLIVLTAVTLLFIGIIVFTAMKNMALYNQDMKNLYSERMLPSLELKNWRLNFT